MFNREQLENCLYSAVELTDFDNNVKKGWFVKKSAKEYVLLPFDDIWHTYIYHKSHIKKIKFLTNGFEIK